MKITLNQAEEKLKSLAPQKFAELFRHGSMSIELYQPEKVDLQTPHQQDELYVIISGYGKFACGEQVFDFEPFDVLFVPAGLEHRFLDFSTDFKVWVIFYGSKGGETELK
jgi:mannose-6-phosphate isomerase-like protein (cupin superfamily)